MMSNIARFIYKIYDVFVHEFQINRFKAAHSSINEAYLKLEEDLRSSATQKYKGENFCLGRRQGRRWAQRILTLLPFSSILQPNKTETSKSAF